MNFNMKKIIILLMLLCVASLTNAQTFYNVTALNTVNTPKVDYANVQTWSSVGAIFNVSGSISTASDGVSANWKEGYDHSPISLNYANPTLTLTRQDGTTLTTTINASGGDFVPIAGNLGNPMTGDIYVTAIRRNNTNDNIAIGLGAVNSNLGVFNIGLGGDALRNTTVNSSNNIGLGAGSLYSCTDGQNNVGISGALSFLTTGNDNIAIGQFAATNIVTGSKNLAIGDNSLQVDASSSNNIAIGSNAGSVNSATPTNNAIFIGNHSGQSAIGDDWVYIGHSSSTSNTSVIYGKSTTDINNNYIRIQGDFFVKDWSFKQVTTGLNIYYNNVFKARIGADGDLYLSGTTVHYNATE